MERLLQIQARIAEIRSLLNAGGDDLDLTALSTEVDQLEEERKSINAEVEARANLERRVAEGAFPVLRAFGTPNPGTEPTERTFDATSPEYRSAFLRTLARDPQSGEMRLGQLSDAERRAWTMTTANTGSVIPTVTMNKIWDLVSERYAMIKDISIDHVRGVVKFNQHTAIAAGGAAATDEGVANADMEFTFVPVELTTQEVKAHVDLSATMQFTSIEALEDYLVKHLGQQIGEKMNKILIAAIDADIDDDNKIATEAGVALSDVDIKKAFARLRGGVRRICYASSDTIWNHIANVKNEEGDEKFIESAVSDDPEVQGRIYGAIVKLDDTIPAGVMYVGDPATVVANSPAETQMLSNTDVKSFVTTHGSMSLFGARLGHTRGFAKITVTPSA